MLDIDEDELEETTSGIGFIVRLPKALLKLVALLIEGEET